MPRWYYLPVHSEAKLSDAKQQALVAPPPTVVPAAAVAPEPIPQERVGHRLRSAISDLGKMSAPGR